jgi:hypothetical protein
MRVAAAAVAAIALAGATAYATQGSAAASGTGAVTKASITRSAHIAFENCNARQIQLSVTVPTHAFRSSQEVTFLVRLHNTGSTACGTPSAKHVPPARRTFDVGSCGILSLVVRASSGVSVYPGPSVYFCPEESGLRLGPHGTAQTSANWSQAAYLGSPPKPQHAPIGTYHLVVAGAVTVPVTLIPG